MRYKITKKFLIFWCLFIGIGAVFGSICMFIDPTGKLLKMDTLLPYFQVLPFSNILFQNYIFSGIALLIVNGISNLVAAFLIIKDKKVGIILGTVFGFTLMLWIIIQFVIFPQNVLSTTFFILGIIQLITGYMTYIFYNQERFKFDVSEYKNIGKNRDILVVYFSRMRYTKKIAYEEANKVGADIIEIKSTERTENTLGFWWCGRYGMHKWNMPIEDINIDIRSYKKIIIVSPIWVFSVAAPIRNFCYKYSKEINSAEYIFTHFMNVSFENVADEVDKILNQKREKFTSICVRLGKKIKVSETQKSKN